MILVHEIARAHFQQHITVSLRQLKIQREVLQKTHAIMRQAIFFLWTPVKQCF